MAGYYLRRSMPWSLIIAVIIGLFVGVWYLYGLKSLWGGAAYQRDLGMSSSYGPWQSLRLSCGQTRPAEEGGRRGAKTVEGFKRRL